MPIDLGPLRFRATDEYGVTWACAEFEGWDSPVVETDMAPRTAAHGMWAGPSWWRERVVSMEGTITAPDAWALDDALERLYAAVPLEEVDLTVHERRSTMCRVRRSAPLRAKRLTDRIARYSLQVTADDPRRYGLTEQSEATGLPFVSGGLVLPVDVPFTIGAQVTRGQVAVVNEGGTAVSPVIRFSGPVTRPMMAFTGADGSHESASLVYGGKLLAGQWVDIDCAQRTVLLAGTVNRRYLLSGPWPELAPGLSVLQFRAETYDPAARMSVTFRPAWI